MPLARHTFACPVEACSNAVMSSALAFILCNQIHMLSGCTCVR